MTVSLEMNRRALALADQLAADPLGYGIRVETLSNGARLIDCGLTAPGGQEAGRLFAEISMGGLSTVTLGPLAFEGTWLPGVAVRTDHPAWACLAAQAGGRTLRQADYESIISGPGRCLRFAQDSICVSLGYAEDAEAAVLCVEGRTPPPPDVTSRLAAQLGIAPQALTLLIAPTGTTAGSVQVAARVLEVPMLKLHHLGFDTCQILSGFGACPLAPVAADDLHAMGRTNDAVLYGGTVHFVVRADEAELEAIVARLPASSSADYGAPFYDIFQRFNFEFYRLDPLIFGPAEVFFTNVITGRTHHAGQVRLGVLRQSFGLGPT